MYLHFQVHLYHWNTAIKLLSISSEQGVCFTVPLSSISLIHTFLAFLTYMTCAYVLFYQQFLCISDIFLSVLPVVSFSNLSVQGSALESSSIA